MEEKEEEILIISYTYAIKFLFNEGLLELAALLIARSTVFLLDDSFSPREKEGSCSYLFQTLFSRGSHPLYHKIRVREGKENEATPSADTKQSLRAKPVYWLLYCLE